MATVKCDFRCDLTKPIKVEYLDGNIFTMDNGGNTINVYCYEGEEPATLGGSVSANVIRPDGTTVPVSGAIDGNKAYVTLQQAAYAVPGHVTIIIKVTQGTTVTTIAAIVANNMLSSTDTIVDPGTIIPSVQALIAQIETAVGSIPADYSALLATMAADYSSSKTYAVGDYAWQAGVLKRCIVPITTAETYTAAHWTNAVLGDDLSALKSAFNADILAENVAEQVTGSWSQGGYKTADGTASSSNYRIRRSLFDYDTNVGIRVIVPEGLKLLVFIYENDAGNTYIGYKTWQYGEVVELGNGKKYKIVAANEADTTAIVPSAGDSIQVYAIGSTDKTLSQNDKAADASATGEAIKANKEFIDDNAEYTDSFIENQLGIREYLFLNDGGINTSGETIDITNIVTPSNGSDWKCTVIPCSPGDIFYIKVYSAYSYYRPWAFVALDGTKISAATTGNVSAHVSAPENAAYLVSNAASFHDRKPTITKGESKVYQFENYLKGGFRSGDWRSDVPKETLSRDYRVRSQSQITYPYDIELIAEPGYSFYFHTYDGDDFRLQTVFSTHYATIPANTEFDITISADPLDTSVTANPEVYRKGVKVYRRRFETYAQNWQPLNRDKVRIEGHRGWMGDTTNYPENSIPAFEKAAQMGVWMIETDIQETSDGYFVCMHDSTVDRTTDGTGTIASKTLEEVQALHLIGGDGTLKVPTLEQYLRICNIYNIVCHIEIKSVNDEKTSIPRIIKAVEAYGLINQTSYNPHTLTAADIIRQNVYFAPIHLLVETTSEKWETFEERVNACECMGSIRCGTDDFGNVANAYKEQIAEIHARGMITAKMSGSWDAQKAYLGVGFDLCVSNSNLTIPT